MAGSSVIAANRQCDLAYNITAELKARLIAENCPSLAPA